MSQQIVNNTDTDPDTLKAGITKINDNFTELYSSTIPPFVAHGLPNWGGENLALIGQQGDVGQVGIGTVFNGTTAYAVPSFEYSGSVIPYFAMQKNQTSPVPQARAGIYATNGTSGFPQLLVKDFGEIAFGGSHAGIEYWDLSADPLVIPNTGIYWFIVVFSGTTPQIPKYNYLYSPIGYNDPGTTNPTILATRYMGLSHPMALGALPLIFPNDSVAWLPTSSSLPCMLRSYGN